MNQLKNTFYTILIPSNLKIRKIGTRNITEGHFI
jgi:hypothetical protein